MNARPVISLFFALIGCSVDQPSDPPAAGLPDRAERMAMEQQAMRIEARDIAAYVERHRLNATATGTGLRYVLLRDVPGPAAAPDDVVEVNHRIGLIDGRTCYASEPGHPERFRVEHDDVESGLHEAIQFMSPGDSAILIIPSHRAHGLVGDRDRIPMRSTVIYHLGLVSVQRAR